MFMQILIIFGVIDATLAIACLIIWLYVKMDKARANLKKEWPSMDIKIIRDEYEHQYIVQQYEKWLTLLKWTAIPFGIMFALCAISIAKSIFA